MKIYVYPITYDDRKAGAFEECTDTEMFVHRHIHEQHTIVQTIEIADIAYIPVYNASLRYTHPSLHRVLWEEKIKPLLPATSHIPHFTTWCYVLYDVDISFIPSWITVWAYEAEVSLPNRILRVDNGCGDRMVVIPYNLEAQSHIYAKVVASESVVLTSFNPTTWLARKSAVFVGVMNTVNTPIRKMRDHYMSIYQDLFHVDLIEPLGVNLDQIYSSYQFAFVLRGDTTSRKAFYNALHNGCFPIVTEDALHDYLDLFRGMYHEIIRQLVLTVPFWVLPDDHKCMPDRKAPGIDYESLHKQMVEKICDVKRLLPLMYDLTRNKLDYRQGGVCDLALHASLHPRRKKCPDKTPLIFNYVLPARFNTEVLPVQISTSEKVTMDTDHSQYFTEPMLHLQFAHYPYMTSCIARADMAFIPIYTFLNAWRTAGYYDVQACVRAVKEVLKMCPTWLQYHHIPHIMVYGDMLWADERVFLPHVNLPANTCVLSLDSVSRSALRCITLPYPTSMSLWREESKCCAEPSYILGYVGRTRPWTSDMLVLQDDYLVRIIDLVGWKSTNDIPTIQSILDVYRKCAYSWQPVGDGRTRGGFYQSLLCGCIPVVHETNASVYLEVLGGRLHLEQGMVIIPTHMSLLETTSYLRTLDRRPYVEYVARVRPLLMNYFQVLLSTICEDSTL